MGCGGSKSDAKGGSKGEFKTIAEISIQETGVNEDLDKIFSSYGGLQNSLASINNGIVDANEAVVSAIDAIVDASSEMKELAGDILKASKKAYIPFAIKVLRKQDIKLSLNDDFSISWTTGKCVEAIQDAIDAVKNAVEKVIEAVKNIMEQIPAMISSISELVVAIAKIKLDELKSGVMSKASNPIEGAKAFKKILANINEVKKGPETATGVKNTATAIKDMLTGDGEQPVETA